MTTAAPPTTIPVRTSSTPAAAAPVLVSPAPSAAVTQSTTAAPECPECAAAVKAMPTLAGEILDCTDCGAELEVMSLAPLRLQLAPDVEEDWGE